MCTVHCTHCLQLTTLVECIQFQKAIQQAQSIRYYGVTERESNPK